MAPENMIVTKYIEANHRNFELNIDRAKSSKTTMVWFVGIAGFLLANSKSIWVDFLGQEFFSAQPLNYLLLLIPLAVAVMVSFKSYFAIENWMGWFGRFYKNYVGALELHQVSEEEMVFQVHDLFKVDTEDEDELLKVMQDTKSKDELHKQSLNELIELKQSSLASLKRADRWESVATWAFTISVSWTLIFPVALLLFATLN